MSAWTLANLLFTLSVRQQALSPLPPKSSWNLSSSLPSADGFLWRTLGSLPLALFPSSSFSVLLSESSFCNADLINLPEKQLELVSCHLSMTHRPFPACPCQCLWFASLSRNADLSPIQIPPCSRLSQASALFTSCFPYLASPSCFPTLLSCCLASFYSSLKIHFRNVMLCGLSLIT